MDTVTEQITAPTDTARSPAAPAALCLRDEFGPLLRLDRRDVAGLTWCKNRARFWLTALKRRRKYQVDQGAAYTPEEGALIEALTALENAVSRLLLAQTSSLCPVSETCPEHTRQGDAENSRTQSSHKKEADIEQARTGP